MDLTASIVIPTLNRERVLCQTLDSILSVADASGLIEIIVVDQSATHEPETLRRLQTLSQHPLIKYCRVSFRGTTSARNYGTSLARGDVIIFVDDDVLVYPGFVQAHLKPYSGTTLAGVAGCVIHEGESKMEEADLDPSTVRRLRSGKQALFNVSFPYDIRWARGCNMSFRRDWILKVGGFDENFYGIAVGEEPEFCHRITEAGGQIRFVPDTELFHCLDSTGGSRDQKNDGARFIAYIDNAVYFWYCVEPRSIKRFWEVAKLAKSSLCKSNVLFSGKLSEHVIWCVTGIQQAIQRFSHRRPNTQLSY